MLSDVVIALKNKTNANRRTIRRALLLDLIEFKYLPVRYL